MMSRRRSHVLPDAMRAGDVRANRVDRAAIDLAEAIVLQGREGEVFDAVVTDEDDRGVRIQVCDPADRRACRGSTRRSRRRRAGQAERAPIPTARTVEFERVG